LNDELCALSTLWCRGIIAEVRSADSRLKFALGKNDSTLLSKESAQLLRTTLHNWGHTIRSIGSASESADDDVEGQVADDKPGSAAGNGGKASDANADGSGKEDGGKANDKEPETKAAHEDGLQVRGWCCACVRTLN
jgi:hypothetical protein